MSGAAVRCCNSLKVLRPLHGTRLRDTITGASLVCLTWRPVPREWPFWQDCHYDNGGRSSER
jgi:hypothetical protein